MCQYLKADNGKLSLGTVGNLFPYPDLGTNRLTNILKNVFLVASGVPYYNYTRTGAGDMPDPCSGGIRSNSFCANYPNISGISFVKNGSTGISGSGWYTLKFNVSVDAEQMPIKTLEINWGDGSANVVKQKIDTWSSNAQPTFMHYYSGTPATSYPKITVTDNWGFYDEATR
jgi:hypothetical protein